jgi:hypothetical protein
MFLAQHNLSEMMFKTIKNLSLQTFCQYVQLHSTKLRTIKPQLKLLFNFAP